MKRRNFDMKQVFHFKSLLVGTGLILLGSLAQPPIACAAVLPASDSSNNGNWIFDPSVSDEFDGASLDTNKWYNYAPGWSGRPPSQFDPSAVSVSNGNLVLNTTCYNLVNDGSFEQNDLSAWGESFGTYGLATAYKDSKYGYNAAYANGGSGLQQQISLSPNTTYKLIGYARCGSASGAQTGTRAFIGIKGFNNGAGEVAQVVTSTTYQLVSILFTTGSTTTNASVYLYNPDSGTIYGDDIAVIPATLPDGTVLNGDSTTATAYIESTAIPSFGYYEA